MAEAKIKVSVEKAINDALLKLIANAWKQYGVKVEYVTPEWIEYRSVGGNVHLSLASIRTDLKTFNTKDK